MDRELPSRFRLTPMLPPTARTAQVLPVGQLDGGTVCQRHDRVDPVGMVAVVAVPVIGHHQGQLPRLHARQVHIRILGIPRGQVRNRTAAVEGILGIDKLRTARIEQSHELVAVGRVVRRPNNMVIPVWTTAGCWPNNGACKARRGWSATNR